MIAPKYYGIDESIRDAFVNNGFETILYNYKTEINVIERIVIKISRTARCLELLLSPINWLFLILENLLYCFRCCCVRPSFLLVIKGEFLLPFAVRLIRTIIGVPVVSYQWDDPFYSHADHRAYDSYRRQSFVKSMPYFDHIFVFDSEYLKKILAMGIKNADFLPLATDTLVFAKMKLSEEEKREFGYDVCFVGLPSKNRVKMFNDLVGIKLGVFGDHWDKWKAYVKGDYYIGKASGKKVLKLYSASKIVLNIHHPQSIAGANTRTFDVLACGAFEIVDYKSDIAKLFIIGEEIVCFKDEQDLQEKIRYYLRNPEERMRISVNGYKKVVAEHTWDNRVRQICAVLEKNDIVSFVAA